MSFFDKKRKPIYFINRSFKTELQKKSDLILSPEFYWVKKVSLNLKYSYEAIKMAVSVFDGILPQGNFKYRVFKLKNGEFVFIAFDLSAIIKELNQLGIDMQMVDKIYTAQSEFANRDIALKIDDKSAITNIDGVLTYIPLKHLDTSFDLSEVIQEKRLSKEYIYSKNLQKKNLNSKQLNQILTILLILVTAQLFTIAKLQKETKEIESKKEELIQRYNLPKTNFQIESLQNELSTIDKEQNGLKKAMEYTGKFRLQKNEFFNQLSYKKSTLKLTVKLKNRKREEQFKKYISKKYNIIKSKKDTTGFMIEVKV